MANVEREKRCLICARLIAVKRLRRFHRAVTCGSETCQAENYRRMHNRASVRSQRLIRQAKRLAKDTDRLEMLRKVRQDFGPTVQNLPSYLPPADGASDSADPHFRARERRCGRCPDMKRTPDCFTTTHGTVRG